MSAIIFALLSALCFAWANSLARISLSKHPSMFSAIVVMSSAAIVSWFIVFISGKSIPTGAPLFFFILRGLIDPGLAALFIFTAFRKLGIAIVVPIIAASPLISTALSVVLFGEKLTLLILAGTALIIGGVAVLTFRHVQKRIHLSYIFFAIAGTVCIALGAVVTKQSLNVGGSVQVGIAIAFSVGIILQLLVAGILGKVNDIPHTLKSAKLLIAAGPIVVGAFFFSFLAYGSGNLSITGPLISTQPFFALIISHLFLRNHESITKNVIVGSALIVAGASMLALA